MNVMQRGYINMAFNGVFPSLLLHSMDKSVHEEQSGIKSGDANIQIVGTNNDSTLQCERTSKRQAGKKRPRKRRKKCKSQDEKKDEGSDLDEEVLTPIFHLDEKKMNQMSKHDLSLAKYFYQRYRLWSKYDDGIWMDKEGWYSVTAEKIAQHIARRCCDVSQQEDQTPLNLSENAETASNSNCQIYEYPNQRRDLVILDAFCGCGGNAIQFAMHPNCRRVIALDISPVRLICAMHNAKIYGVDHKIDFLLCDFIDFISMNQLKIDVICLAPPWGGIDYLAPQKTLVEPQEKKRHPKRGKKGKKRKFVDYEKLERYNIDEQIILGNGDKQVNGSDLYLLSRKHCKDICYILPRTVSWKQVSQLADYGDYCEIENNFLGEKHICTTVYFGQNLILHQKLITDDYYEKKIFQENALITYCSVNDLEV